MGMEWYDYAIPAGLWMTNPLIGGVAAEGYLAKKYATDKDFRNSSNEVVDDIIYNLTGYDILGRHKPDYYGTNIKRNIATELSEPRRAAYDAMAKQIAQEYSKSRELVNRSAMDRGLSKAGFTAEQERELAGQEATAKSSVWADLLQQEQNFLDNLYMQNKDIGLKLALQERNEALLRQIMFTNFMKTITSDVLNTILPIIMGG